jgi:hypothetical protein
MSYYKFNVVGLFKVSFFGSETDRRYTFCACHTYCAVALYDEGKRWLADYSYQNIFPITPPKKFQGGKGPSALQKAVLKLGENSSPPLLTAGEI